MGSQSAPSGSSACSPFQVYALKSTLYGKTLLKGGISGMISRNGASIRIADVLDGSSNTIQVGETLPSCLDADRGSWSYAQSTCNAETMTLTPINEFTTCDQLGPSRRITNSACTAHTQWNYSLGFKSMHSGGAPLPDGRRCRAFPQRKHRSCRTRSSIWATELTARFSANSNPV